MLFKLPRRWLVLAAAIAVIAVLTGGALLFFRKAETRRAEETLHATPEAPPDLAKLRPSYVAGVEAVGDGHGAEAIRHLSSFHFGSRDVEQYRLYHLAKAYELAGRNDSARATFVRLSRRAPTLVHATEAAFSLAGHHALAGDWLAAATTYRAIAARTENPAVAAAARWQEVESRITAGDIAGASEAARLFAIKSPRAPQVAAALALFRSLNGLGEKDAIPLNVNERFERAANFLRDGDPRNTIDELAVLEPSAPAALKLPIQLNRGIALHQMRRYEDSIRVLEPLTSSYYKYAVPALFHLAKNYRILSASIDPNVTKTVTEKKRAGTIRVKVGKGKKARTVKKPKYVNVKKTIKLVDLAKKAKKEQYERLASERLKDMLQLPIVPSVRLDVLNALIAIAQAKNQAGYVQELVAGVIAIDPLADPALQYLWDRGWSAYTRGDLPTAKTTLRFIADTYTNPNVKRQSEYWYARTIERQGDKESATAIYAKLASAPYADLYAIHSVNRGAKREDTRSNPLNAKREDWNEIAEKSLPKELRLAYELTALTDYRDARLEIQKNMRRENTRFAEALLSEIYHSTGNHLLMYKSIRRAWPQLATVEQDTVPAHFLKMYYPVKYHDTIKKYAERQKLDPNLVMGLILQESYYDPRAKSRVGATGLMQIMPPTGKELAGKLRIPFAVARLENPEVNVQLGTLHLRNLINMFGGNAYLAVASYNAGQGNVMKWQRANRGKPLDEFLESIPFPETRNYVKRVTMLRSSYSRIAT